MASAPTSKGRFLGEGKYELLTPIGLGAMGIVHLARHVALDRVVAVKLLSPGVTARPETAERFLSEARTASLLRHKNTTHVLDFGGDQANGFYFVMEYIEGRSLADVLAEEGALAPARAIHLVSQVLAALGEAHDFGIVHKDIKPGNVMLVPWTDDDGREVELVKILDFGIATMYAEPRWAMKAEVAGTPEFMSPEQAQGLAVDPRSDIYAVGALLYTIVCGEMPFAAETPVETMVAQVSSAPRSPRSLVPKLSEAFERVVLRALEKAPADRFPSARAFRAALLELPEVAPRAAPSAVVPALGPQTGTGLAPTGPAPKRRAVGWWLALALLLAGGSAVLAWRLTVSSRDAAPPPPPVAETRPVVTPPAPVNVATKETPAPVVAVAPQPKPQPKPLPKPPEPVATPIPYDPPAPGPTTYVVPRVPWPDLPPAETLERVAEVEPDEAATKPEPKPEPDTASTETTKPPADPIAAPELVTDAQPKPAVPEVVTPPVDPVSVVPEKPLEKAPALAASAAIGGLDVRGSLPRSAVTRALDATRAALEACYRSAATAAQKDLAGSASARLEIDIDGHARNVSVSSLGLPGLQACVTQALARVRTKDRPDTGTVGASFQITFTPREP